MCSPLLLSVLVLTMCTFVDGSDHESRLLLHLFTDYNKNIRPVRNENSTVNIRIKHTVKQIFNVDERKELLFTSGWFVFLCGAGKISQNRGGGGKVFFFSNLKISGVVSGKKFTRKFWGRKEMKRNERGRGKDFSQVKIIIPGICSGKF